ncbi:cell division protein DedD [Photorhabdus heterorhabditis]|uniref:Cell division protein DedD n=1 Tax=Photorhabdus heterorhabditis TaxID=880156 RepID=A0ABR5K976_9GAMM|nr:cell division protein DedD [Photorhabdus heterorhabditis]KOY61113.1 cell division protein DedD [Photorhabdus heterorhabditis]
MASKFQNRLVGTIVLVALGVIVLPVLLDGNKKYNEDKFASIPLVPKPGDEQEIESISPLNSTILSVPLEDETEVLLPETLEQPEIPLVTVPPQPAPITPPAVQPEVKPKLQSKPEQKTDPKPLVSPEPKAKLEVKPESKIETKPVEKAPQGQAYIVQLGALKNAGKVDEIVARLRLSGYQVYTVPSSPVQGQLTRIYVGPNVSRQQLESALSDLKSLTGLQGQVRGYKP